VNHGSTNKRHRRSVDIQPRDADVTHTFLGTDLLFPSAAQLAFLLAAVGNNSLLFLHTDQNEREISSLKEPNVGVM